MINLDDLDDDQRAAATAPRGPVCIIAGAGTGKTRTITYRIANLIDQGFVAPQRILAVTFTARAAGEMRERLNHMGIGGVQARTFHAAARRQLSYFWPSIAGNLQWKLIDNKFPLVGRAVRSVGLDNSTDMVRDVLSEIEWAKATLLTPETYVQAAQKHSGRRPPADPEKIAAAYRRYEEMKTTDEACCWTSTICCCTLPQLWKMHPESQKNSANNTAVSLSTNTRMSPHCSSASWTAG